ncbi:unnamed protein product [Symbiodinium natans]|uniref:Alpha-L-arabinofuranosidase B arabinose-binding domain-containing protein n=1 Tax=Symbiodinium natans TaxID=878477 RepID=A0A812V4B4_9DINO|nr:unnamed protein product [Symbiodinium natans]
MGPKLSRDDEMPGPSESAPHGGKVHGVVVRKLNGTEVLRQELPHEATLLSLKQALGAEVGLPAAAVKLLNGSEPLQPDHALIGDLLQGDAELTLVQLQIRRVYFESLAWRGGHQLDGIAGLSSNAEPGSLLTNQKDKSPWLLHLLPEGGIKFESEKEPGHFICNADGHGRLRRGNGTQEAFRELPALNGEEDAVTLESLGQPGAYLCHCNGRIFCHSLTTRMQLSDRVFNNDASWRLVDCD